MACRALQRIDLTTGFVAFWCAYYYFDPLGTFSPFLFSVVLHECGHIAALYICRMPIHRIHLGLTGIQIVTPPLPYRTELIVASGGPIMNFLLLFLLRGNATFAFVNFCSLCYNLLPLLPLDGGRILHALLHLLLPQRIASIAEHLIGLLCFCLISLITCYLTCIWHAGLWPILSCALIFARIGGTILKEKRFFAH